MTITHTILELKTLLAECRAANKRLGLVPTMGALHEGHISLVRRSAEENDCTVVSIFVNPTQFNDASDLEKYPRTLEADCALLEQVSRDLIVFAPAVKEVYPEPDARVFSYPPTDVVMEGAKRPGHFNGVCQIVSKLFAWVEPDTAYFGEKDFQQIAVIRAMVKDLGLSLQIVACPIVREANGLAMSSRNTRLTEEEREQASAIRRILVESVELAERHSVEYVRHWVTDRLNAMYDFEVEYYEIVDGVSLISLEDWQESAYVVGCITVYCGADRVRLIDNITYKNKSCR